MPDAIATSVQTLSVQASLAVVVHHAEGGGFWVEVPAFAGVYAEGETVEEATRNASAVLTDYFQRREQGRARFEATQSQLSDEHGPIPTIMAINDCRGVWMPIPARVKEARRAVSERAKRVLDLLPDDLPEDWEEMIQGIGSPDLEEQTLSEETV